MSTGPSASLTVSDTKFFSDADLNLTAGGLDQSPVAAYPGGRYLPCAVNGDDALA